MLEVTGTVIFDMQPKIRCLTDLEEVKIERMITLLKFLGRREVTNFVETGPFRFDPATTAFYDDITDRAIAPSDKMIELFYNRLCRDAMSRLQMNAYRSNIKGLRKLLVRFNNLDFLPLAI